MPRSRSLPVPLQPHDGEHAARDTRLPSGVTSVGRADRAICAIPSSPSPAPFALLHLLKPLHTNAGGSRDVAERASVPRPAPVALAIDEFVAVDGGGGLGAAILVAAAAGAS
jgi:hypothetical protein